MISETTRGCNKKWCVVKAWTEQFVRESHQQGLLWGGAKMVLRYFLFSSCLYLSWNAYGFRHLLTPRATEHSWLAQSCPLLVRTTSAGDTVAELLFLACGPSASLRDRSSFQKLSRSLAGAGFRRYVDALALRRPHYKLHRAPRARGIDYTAAVVRDLVSYTGPLAGAPPTQPQVFELAWRAPRSNAREAGVQAPTNIPTMRIIAVMWQNTQRRHAEPRPPAHLEIYRGSSSVCSFAVGCSAWTSQCNTRSWVEIRRQSRETFCVHPSSPFLRLQSARQQPDRLLHMRSNTKRVGELLITCCYVAVLLLGTI